MVKRENLQPACKVNLLFQSAHRMYGAVRCAEPHGKHTQQGSSTKSTKPPSFSTCMETRFKTLSLN